MDRQSEVKHDLENERAERSALLLENMNCQPNQVQPTGFVILWDNFFVRFCNLNMVCIIVIDT